VLVFAVLINKEVKAANCIAVAGFNTCLNPQTLAVSGD